MCVLIRTFKKKIKTVVERISCSCTFRVIFFVPFNSIGSSALIWCSFFVSINETTFNFLVRTKICRSEVFPLSSWSDVFPPTPKYFFPLPRTPGGQSDSGLSPCSYQLIVDDSPVMSS